MSDKTPKLTVIENPKPISLDEARKARQVEQTENSDGATGWTAEEALALAKEKLDSGEWTTEDLVIIGYKPDDDSFERIVSGFESNFRLAGVLFAHAQLVVRSQDEDD